LLTSAFYSVSSPGIGPLGCCGCVICYWLPLEGTQGELYYALCCGLFVTYQLRCSNYDSSLGCTVLVSEFEFCSGFSSFPTFNSIHTNVLCAPLVFPSFPFRSVAWKMVISLGERYREALNGLKPMMLAVWTMLVVQFWLIAVSLALLCLRNGLSMRLEWSWGAVLSFLIRFSVVVINHTILPCFFYTLCSNHSTVSRFVFVAPFLLFPYCSNESKVLSSRPSFHVSLFSTTAAC